MLNYYNDIVLINKNEIIGIVRSALSKIDPRLVDHGERVGYIATKICNESQDKLYFNFSKLFVLCALHDIGAYKTNEIDDMVKFETDASFAHSLYGYLFLKNTRHLAAYAEAILYHHTAYSVTKLKNCHCSKYAELIHLADRADILMASEGSDLSALKPLSGTVFNPEYVEALFKAEAKYQISQTIASGNYKKRSDELIKFLEIKNSEIIDYLKLLVYAIDFRSPYTVTHTADTTMISLETGKLLGLSEHDSQSLYLGAFLHDIGKIAIPHTILEKPDKLTPEEFEIIKSHISEGEQILRGVISDEICDIALRHHEKMNGSGYPKGLTASELTLPQRILAVADILSALSQERSYKPAFPKPKVIAILTDMKEKGLLCPLVVDTVCHNYDLILNNTEKKHDPLKTLYADMLQEYAKLTQDLPPKT